MAYIPHSENEEKEMLKFIGVDRFEELLKDIPEEVKFKGEFNIPNGMSEMDLVSHFRDLVDKNSTTICFAGGGAYDHYVPAAIAHVLQRSEFYTAYTPYQAEVSQGTLQAIYEYQTLISRLLKMDVVNASMYDGGTALAEAVLMAHNINNRKKIVVSNLLNPRYLQLIRTYTSDMDVELVVLNHKEGTYDPELLRSAVDENTSAVIVQQPNFFGILEDPFEVSKIAKEKGALLISVVEPTSLSLISPPGDYDADIVVAEGQPLGIPLNFGGPYVGIFATKKDYIRKMPGRLIGMTEDRDGKRGFVMVMQTREQHIRREKATSNICTNSGLMALAVTVYLSLLGKTGFEQLGQTILSKGAYLADQIQSINGFRLKYNKPFYKEFLVETPVPAGEIIKKLAEKKILAGIDVSRYDIEEGLLIAVTEKRTKEEMDLFVKALKEFA
jgi:glycine dehydrogenase subunit 1